MPTSCPPEPLAAAEFIFVFGGTTPISISNYYGCDPQVPTSGTISFNDMRCIPKDEVPNPLPPTSYEPFETGACYPVIADTTGSQTGTTCEGVGYGYSGPYNGGGMGIAVGHNFQSTGTGAGNNINRCGHVWQTGSTTHNPEFTVTQNQARLNFYEATRTISDQNARTFYSFEDFIREADTTTGTDKWVFDMVRKQGRTGARTTTNDERAVGTERGLISLYNGVNIQSPHNTVDSITFDYKTWKKREVKEGDEFKYVMDTLPASSTTYNCNTYRFISAGFLNATDGFQDSKPPWDPLDYGQGYMALKSFSAPNYTRYTFSSLFGYAAIEYGNKKSSGGELIWYARHDLPANTTPVIMETRVKVLTT